MPIMFSASRASSIEDGKALAVLFFIILIFSFLVGAIIEGFRNLLLIGGIGIWSLQTFFWLLGYLPLYFIDSYRASLDDETRTRIERAFPLSQLSATQGGLYYRQWKKYVKLHRELETCDLKELERRLEASDILNPYVSALTKLKPMEEILTLSIWQSKNEKALILQRATEEDLKKATADAETASDLTQGQEAIRRIEHLKPESTESIPWEFDNLTGSAILSYQASRCSGFSLEVEPGVYTITVEDKTENANGAGNMKTVLSVDSEPVSVRFPAPIKVGLIRIKQRDITELIPLSA